MAELRLSSLRHRAIGEDVDPAVGLLNIGDLMLVLAVGLMMSLVTFWKVDVGAPLEIVEAEAITEVDNLKEAKNYLDAGSSAYSAVGSVYMDSETGDLYMITTDLEKAGALEAAKAAKE